MRKLAVLEKQGKIKVGTLREWVSKTPNIRSLPERVKKKKSKAKKKKAC